MNTFLITGYPRSRTAWLSNFLTFGSSFCFHEPVVYTPVEKLCDLLKSAGTNTAGISDSGAIFYYKYFLDEFPRAKIVIVKRDSKEVVKSMLRLGFDFRAAVCKFEEAFYEIEKRHEVLIVPFGALPAAEIWEHCVAEEPVNKMRLQMLENFKLVLKEEVIQRQFTEGVDKIIKTGRLIET